MAMAGQIAKLNERALVSGALNSVSLNKVGLNRVPRGMEDEEDTKWEIVWEDLYDSTNDPLLDVSGEVLQAKQKIKTK